ncbi:MAG: S1C family serine protease [Solirubrobacteraceae bacterium]
MLEEIGSAIGEAAGIWGPAVVGIGRRGSGVVVGPGEVLTLASNIGDPSAEVAVALSGAPGGRARAGTVAGVDGTLDLALIHVATGEIAPLEWAAGPADLGQAVIALANPGGQGLRATLGFVAATGRSYRGPRGRLVGGALEHTAPLPRGAGGGPLLDVRGRLLGLNAVRVHGGLILTLPGAAVAERAAVLRRPEPTDTPQLGVAIVSPQVARRLRRAVGLPDRDGLLVHGVAAGSPADQAQIREGDLIVAAGQAPVDRLDALYAALDRVSPTGTVDLRIVRGVDEHDVAVSFGGSR